MWRIVFRASHRAFPGPLLNMGEIAPSFFSMKPTGAKRRRDMDRQALAGMLIGVAVISGCVSVESLDQDLASGNAERIVSAEDKMVKAITTGKANFSSFDLNGRVWCAKSLKSKDAIRKSLETMSYRRSWDPNTASRDEIDICLGMGSDSNTPVVSALLENIGPDDAVADLLSNGKIGYSSTAYQVAVRYMESYVASVEDKDRLYEMTGKCYNWRELPSGRYQLQCDMLERILPTRIATLVSTAADVKVFLQSNNSISDEIRELAISKIRDQRELVEFLGDSRNKSFVMSLITDQSLLYDLALNEKMATVQWEGASAGEQALAKITDKEALVRIAILAANDVIVRQAERQLGDRRIIVDGLAGMIKSGAVSMDVANQKIVSLKKDEATIELYDAVADKGTKRIVFARLSNADRVVVRSRDIEKCKELIATAEKRSDKTFILGGFYLGMDIADAEMLVGYYFPEWSNSFGYEDDDTAKRILSVPNQESVFARATKSGKVWQFNFGRTMLAKWFTYDAARYEDWASAFSQEHGISLSFDVINQNGSVYWPATREQVYVSLFQTIWTYKNAAMHYRLTYFGEPEISAAGGGVFGTALAKEKYRFISADGGTLRVTLERN